MVTYNNLPPAADTPDLKVGWYGSVNRTAADGSVGQSPANSAQALATGLSNISWLGALHDAELKGIRCIIADIREDAAQILSDCRKLAETIPIIVLADQDQQFAPDYPFGTYVSDLTTTGEMGSSIFWHRVMRAVEAYDKPLTIEDTRSPGYSVFQAIANQTSDWIFIKDLQHRFMVVGENFAATAGLSVDQIIGRDDLEIGSSPSAVKGCKKTDQPGFWVLDDVATRTGEPSVEENPAWTLYSQSGRFRRTYRLPLKNPAGRVFALLVCSQDITEQVRNEQLLAERTSMLARVTDEKQRAQENRKIAENAVEAKSRFFATASHDLRQPLHAIGLFLDSLDKRVIGTDEHHLVLQIKQSCTSLNTLFDSCLDISRLDAGAVEHNIEHFSASDFLDSLTEEFRSQASEKALDFRLSIDNSVFHCDQILLARIVRNLFNNAVQNTERGYLAIDCQTSDKGVVLSVVDSGSGIDGEELESVFNEFYQINAERERHSRGLGLGLSIVKRLCEQLGIGISLESKLGCGSRFTLRVPAGHREYIQSIEDLRGVSLPNNLLALVVEDDQYIRMGMEILLESYGAQTLCVPDAESAIQRLNEYAIAPGAIIADYHLSPCMTGIQAIIDIRKHLGWDLPALLVTGDTSADSVRDAIAYGLPVLHKPVNADELLAAINEQIRRYTESSQADVGSPQRERVNTDSVISDSLV